jgi:hypothetical protein
VRGHYRIVLRSPFQLACITDSAGHDGIWKHGTALRIAQRLLLGVYQKIAAGLFGLAIRLDLTRRMEPSKEQRGAEMSENNRRKPECQNSAGEEKNVPDALVPAMVARGTAPNRDVLICVICFRKFRQLQPALAVSFLGPRTCHTRYCEPACVPRPGLPTFQVQITSSDGPMLAEKTEDRKLLWLLLCIHAGSRIVQEPARNLYYAGVRIAEGEEP